MSIIKNARTRLTTVGVKILVGVSLASNLFIGALLYEHLQSGDTVAEKVNEVLTIRENLSANLRMAIVKLQDEFLSLPHFLKTDPKASILRAVEEAFQVTERQLLLGRDAYSHLFNRDERRDLARNSYIIQTGNDKLRLSLGLFDTNGNFKDAVEHLVLAGNITRAVAKQKSVTDTIAELAGRTSENTRNVSMSIAEVSNAAATNRALAGKVHEYSNKISSQLTSLLLSTTSRLEQLAYSGTPTIQPVSEKTEAS